MLRLKEHLFVCCVLSLPLLPAPSSSSSTPGLSNPPRRHYVAHLPLFRARRGSGLAEKSFPQAENELSQNQKGVTSRKQSLHQLPTGWLNAAPGQGQRGQGRQTTAPGAVTAPKGFDEESLHLLPSIQAGRRASLRRRWQEKCSAHESKAMKDPQRPPGSSRASGMVS